MDIKLQEVNKSPVVQDTTSVALAGVYSVETFEELTKQVQEWAASQGKTLVDIQPVRITLRQAFEKGEGEVKPQ